MASAKEIFVKCDELERLPSANRQNYLFELEWLARELPHACRVLQVGSMDGMRVIRLLEVRPDLELTGLEIEPDLVALAKDNLANVKKDAEFVQGDITTPPPALECFTYTICLNNTLGYIPDTDVAIEQMKRHGEVVVVSVYGEQFNEKLAREYFDAIGLEVREIKNNMIVLQDFSTVRRFPRSVVEAWGGHHIVDTPIGYLTVLSGDGDRQL